MSAAAPLAGLSEHGLAKLVRVLRAEGFAISASEASDATTLLLELACREPELEDPKALRTRLRPVFCKTREEQERFDPIFTEWAHGLAQQLAVRAQRASRTEKPATSSTAAESPPQQVPRWRRIGSMLWAMVGPLFVLVVVAAYLLDRNDGGEPDEKPVAQQIDAAPVAPKAPTLPIPQAADSREMKPRIEGYVPAVRYNREIREFWIWFAVLLPAIAFFGISLPALVLSRTRVRRSHEPLYLNPRPLEAAARQLVPPIRQEISDRLARHMSSTGLDMDRQARRPVLDVRGTIEATLRNNGIPKLKYSHSRIHPSYLLLIDSANERDPRGRFFYQWAERMRREGLEIEILLVRRIADTDSACNIVYGPWEAAAQGNERFKPLSRLRAPKFGERLIVISDGDILTDSEGNWRTTAQRARLYRWRDRVQFTPVEPRDWGAREESIERRERAADPGFIVLPLEESALSAWTTLVLSGQLATMELADPQRYPALLRGNRPQEYCQEEPPPAERIDRLLTQLRVYLGQWGYYWLAACAVPPLVRWELTLLLGQEVLKAMPRPKENDVRDALALYYRRLVRLPWMRQESMPAWLRLRLLAELSAGRQRELRKIVRERLGALGQQANADGIELGFERPPGDGEVAFDAGDPQLEPSASRADSLYLGYMSGLTPEQLVLRAPNEWAGWAGKIKLRPPRDLRERLARVCDHLSAWWARAAWREGLPHLGVSRNNLMLALWLTLPLVVMLLVAQNSIREQGVVAPDNWFMVDKPRLLAWRTGTSVHAVAFSPDGTRAVSGGSDNTLQLWDVSTGQPIGKPLRGHNGIIYCVAFSSDGARIVSGSQDKTLRLWDANTGQLIGKPLQGHTDAVYAVAFDTDGSRIASGSVDETLRLWDAASGRSIGEPLRGQSGIVYSVAFSPDGDRIVSGHVDGSLRLWDARTGRQIGKPLSGHEGAVMSVAFSPDGTRVVSGSADRTWRLWDASSGEPVGPALRGHEDWVTSVAFSPDGSHVLSASGDKTLRLWDARSGWPVGKPLRGHEAWIHSAAFSRDGTRIVSGGEDQTLRVWGAIAGQQADEIEDVGEGAVTVFAMSPDGRRFVTGRSSNTLRLGERHTGSAGFVMLDGAKDEIKSAAFSPDGAYIAGGSVDGKLHFWDAHGGRIIVGPQRTGSDAIESVAFSYDGKLVVCGTDSGSVEIWQAPLNGFSKDATRQAHSIAANKRIVASLNIPNVRRGEFSIGAVAFSPSGRAVVTGERGGAVSLWRVKSGQLDDWPILYDHLSSVLTVAFSTDGTRIASGSADGTVRLWSVQEKKSLGDSLRGHESAVLSVVFSPDSTRLFSVDGSTLRIRNAQTGEPIGSPLPAPGSSAVAVVSGGAYLAAPVQLANTADIASRGKTSDNKAYAQSKTQEPPEFGIKFWRIDPYLAPALAIDSRWLQSLLVEFSKNAQQTKSSIWIGLLAFLMMVAIIQVRRRQAIDRLVKAQSRTG